MEKRNAIREDDRDVIREDQHDGGILTWILDAPGSAVNLLDTAVVRALAARLDEVEDRREDDSSVVAGIILTSAKESFCASADLDAMAAATAADAGAVYDLAVGLATQFRRLETLGVPVVAALNGSALGGGLGLALATHHRIAVDEPGLRFGLPEVGFGLCPGAGGVLRTVRLLGVERSLDELLLVGASCGTQDAIQRGIVDEAVDDAEELLPAARQWILDHPDAVQPWDAAGYRVPEGRPGLPTGNGDHPLMAVLQFLPARLRSRLDVLHNPAPRAILATAVEGLQVDLDTAALVEARYHTQTVIDPVSTAMIGLRHADRKAAGPQSMDATTGAVPDAATVVAAEGAPAEASPADPRREGAGDAAPGSRRADPETVRQMVGDLTDAAAAAARELVASGMSEVSVGRVAEQAGLSSVLFQAVAEAARIAVREGQEKGGLPVDGKAQMRRTEPAQRRLLSAIAGAGRRYLAGSDPARAAALNIASVDGAGFPAWTGGIARWDATG